MSEKRITPRQKLLDRITAKLGEIEILRNDQLRSRGDCGAARAYHNAISMIREAIKTPRKAESK